MSDLCLSSTVSLSSGYSMPRLGFGVYQNYSADESVLEAFKAGYRHVDSAQAYRNEVQVGEALKNSGLARGDVFLTTKCISKTHGYESTLKGVNESLARFGVDYIDLFLIHNAHSGTELRLATYTALEECRQAGKIRTVGVSNYNIKHIEEIKAAGMVTPSVNQIELHPLCQQREIAAYCNEQNIVVQAYCPVIRGKLSHPLLLELAHQHSKEPAQIALRWSLQKGFVPLPKSATPSRIHSNAQLYDFVLGAGDMQRLDTLDQGAAGAISWNPVDVD